MSDVYKQQQHERFGTFMNLTDFTWNAGHADDEMVRAVQEGLARGIARCGEQGVGNEAQHRGTIRQTIELLTGSGLPKPQWTARGVTLFVELLTIGVCVRLVNNRDPIAIEQVPQYAAWVEDMDFCWFCR